MSPVSRSLLCCRIGYSLLGIAISIVGVGIFIWKIDSNNGYASVAYAGLSGALAGWNVILHLMHLQDLWRTWLKGLRLFVATGVLFICISIASLLVFIILGTTHHQQFTVDSFYVTSIWSAWSALWAFLLFWYSKTYRNEFADLTALLDF